MGALTRENLSALPKWLDDKAKFNDLLELVDGQVFKIIVNLLDNKLLSKIPLEYQDELNEVITAIVEDRPTDASPILAKVGAELVNTPVGDEKEKALMMAFWNIILAYIPHEEAEGDRPG